MRRSAVAELTARVAHEKDALVRDAITHVLGRSSWQMSEVIGHAHFKVLPDHTEIFCFDGVDLIHFLRPRASTTQKHGSTFINLKQEYKILYGTEVLP